VRVIDYRACDAILEVFKTKHAGFEAGAPDVQFQVGAGMQNRAGGHLTLPQMAAKGEAGLSLDKISLGALAH
jgi:hypothetical protein